MNAISAPNEGNTVPPQEAIGRLPVGWMTVPLGDVTADKIDQEGPLGGADFVYVDISSIDNRSKRITEPKLLPLVDAPSRARQRLRSGDVLVSMTRPNLNAVAILPPELENSIGSTGFHVLRAKDNVLPRWLFYAVQTLDFVHAMSSLVQGVLYPAVRPKDVRVFRVPLPPTDEQKRIVAEIEKQFKRLDAGVASLERVQAALKRYRASVLKAACEGLLTGNDTLLPLTPLGDVITGLGQGWSPKCELNREPLPGEWAVIKTTAVQSMKYLDRESKPLPETLRPRPTIEVKVGDFLMTRKGPRQRAGVTCLVRATRQHLMVCDTVYRFRCQESRVNPAYLELALNSPQAVSEIDRRKSGINDSGVSLTHEKLGTVLLPIPPLPEQQRIVAEVERRLSVIDEMEATVAANLKRADRLRQSILHRAFSGEL
jgi:type I restriction enzyme S subunit